MAIESSKGHEYPEASETWDRIFPEGTVRFYLHPDGYEFIDQGETKKAPPTVAFKIIREGMPDVGDMAPMPDHGMSRENVEQYFQETINNILIPERQDAVVLMRPLEVKLSDGLEGDRSTCCFEPAERVDSADPLNTHVCSKCKGACGILTEEEKIEINKRAVEAVNGIMAHPVKVIVIHKPSNKHASKVVNLSDVRHYAKAVVQSFPDDDYLDHFVVVEIDGEDVRVSELDV